MSRLTAHTSIVLLITVLLSGCSSSLQVNNDYSRQAVDLPTSMRQPHPLTARELHLARAAWNYFAYHSQPETGLPQSLADVQVTELSDIAAAFSAIMAAQALNVMPYDQFRPRLNQLLTSLGDLDLYGGRYPYNRYNPITLDPLPPRPGSEELLVNASSMARLLSALALVRQRVPSLAPRVDNLLLSWTFEGLVDSTGMIRSGLVDATGRVQWVNNLGWAERHYSAAAFALWEFPVDSAVAGARPREIPVEGQLIPVDRFGKLPDVATTDPWVRHYVEFGWDRPDLPVTSRTVFTAGRVADYADRIYQAQQRRNSRTDLLTARSPHRLRRAPFRVIDAIHAGGHPWSSLSPEGDPAERYTITSARAAVGMWATWDTEYTEELMASLVFLRATDGVGLYEGLLEGQPRPSAVLTAETNGFVLEALLAAVDGPLLTPKLRPGVWQEQRSSNR